MSIIRRGAAAAAPAANQTIFGHQELVVSTAIRYWGLNADTVKGAEVNAQTPIIAGTFTRMIIWVTNYGFDMGASIALRVNGVTSALSIAFTANGLYTDTDPVAVNLNDLVNFMAVGAMSGAAMVNVCLVFEPD